MNNIIQMPKKSANAAVLDLALHAVVDLEDAYGTLNLVKESIANALVVEHEHVKKITLVIRDLFSATDHVESMLVSAGELDEVHDRAIKLLKFTHARLQCLRDLLMPAQAFKHAIDASFVLVMIECELMTLPIILELLRLIAEHEKGGAGHD